MKADGGFKSVLALMVLVLMCVDASFGEDLHVVFFEDFDDYPEKAVLSSGGYGGWVGRWGGNIIVTSEEALSPPYCAKMDNNLGCWESQLYQPLPFHSVLWFSADIMGKATGRKGCHNLDVAVRLYNPDAGTWGSFDAGIELTSNSSLGFHHKNKSGLGAFTSHYEVDGIYKTDRLVNIETDYEALTGRWINVMARVDSLQHQMDIWVDGVHRTSLAMDPACPRYKGLALDCGNGIGYVDNVCVFVPRAAVVQAGVEIYPRTLDVNELVRWVTCHIRLPGGFDVADVQPGTVRLNEKIRPDWSWIEEGGQVLMAKFPWSKVRGVLEVGRAELITSGRLVDGTRFEAVGTIEVVGAVRASR